MLELKNVGTARDYLYQTIDLKRFLIGSLEYNSEKFIKDDEFKKIKKNHLFD